MVYLLLGVGFWFIGRQTSGLTTDLDVEIIKRLSDGFVIVPAWLYWLCGWPRSDNMPVRVVSVRSLMSQLTGILYLVYGCFYYYSDRPAEITSPESFMMPMILGISLGYLLKKIRPFQL
jgi:hypothetical protein